MRFADMPGVTGTWMPGTRAEVLREAVETERSRRRRV